MERDVVVVLDKVFELAGRIGELMKESLTERGLTPARAEVLLVLHHHGEPMVQRELSQALRCTPRHVTALVDALETHDWAVRRPHPTDRRATLVSLTRKGATATGHLDRERRTAARAILGDLPARDLAGFMKVADRVLGHLTPQDTPRSD
ncbi:MAG: MarR family transcriptional regulator [Streptosporangiales bacterium]|nr:MarR family transcriptional regulator [Streptosporangiales bacterium]